MSRGMKIFSLFVFALCLLFVVHLAAAGLRLSRATVSGLDDPRREQTKPALDITAMALIDSFEQLWRDIDSIGVVRPAGSPAIREVQRVLEQRLEAAGWVVSQDSFQSSTPIGPIDFVSVIGSWKPEKTRNRLVLAAHYDSKWFPDPNTFVGATDSAVPCAILLDLARVIAQRQLDMGVDIVFFDGEEAFAQWTATDSIYGARHLAERWEQEGRLGNIRSLTLLDLLGAPNPYLASQFRNTDAEFRMLIEAEELLRQANVLKTANRMFARAQGNFGIEDDHIPFLRRGVPIVHVIATPFPTVWHTPADSLQNLDRNTVEDLCAIFRAYVLKQSGALGRARDRTRDAL